MYLIVVKKRQKEAKIKWILMPEQRQRRKTDEDENTTTRHRLHVVLWKQSKLMMFLLLYFNFLSVATSANWRVRDDSRVCVYAMCPAYTPVYAYMISNIRSSKSTVFFSSLVFYAHSNRTGICRHSVEYKITRCIITQKWPAVPL